MLLAKDGECRRRGSDLQLSGDKLGRRRSSVGMLTRGDAGRRRGRGLLVTEDGAMEEVRRVDRDAHVQTRLTFDAFQHARCLRLFPYPGVLFASPEQMRVGYRLMY